MKPKTEKPPCLSKISQTGIKQNAGIDMQEMYHANPINQDSFNKIIFRISSICCIQTLHI